MTDPAALTDEELALWWDAWANDDSMTVSIPRLTVLSLIANLRAARSQLTEARQDARDEYARAEQAEAEVVRLKADVAELQAEVDVLRSHPHSPAP